MTDLLQGFDTNTYNPTDNFIDQSKELPTRMVSIYDIELNELNPLQDSEEAITEFADAIYEEGQIRSPLNVYRNKEGSGKKYRLLGGHRRLRALLLNAERYGDAQKMVPVIIEKNSSDEIEEKMKILELNEHRSLTPEQEKIIVREYLNVYRQLESNGQKPKGQVRKWIASRMNIGEKKAEKYIHELEGYRRKRNEDPEGSDVGTNEENNSETVLQSAEKEHRKEIIKKISDYFGWKVKDNGSSICIKYKNNKNEDGFYSVLNILGFNEDGEFIK